MAVLFAVLTVAGFAPQPQLGLISIGVSTSRSTPLQRCWPPPPAGSMCPGPTPAAQLDCLLNPPQKRRPQGRLLAFESDELLRELRLRVLRPGDPAGGRSVSLPEEHVQLGGVLLDVAHVVEQQLGKRKLAPATSPQTRSVLIRQRLDRRLALLTSVCEIPTEFGPCIDSFGERAGRVKLAERKWSGGNERFLRSRKVEIEPEQRVVGEVPVRRERGQRAVFPQPLAPQLVGAATQSVFEHVDRGPELPPEECSPHRSESNGIAAADREDTWAASN